MAHAATDRLLGAINRWIAQSQTAGAAAAQRFVSDHGVLELVYTPGLPSGADVPRPDTALTPRERDTLEAIVGGETNAQAARALHISERTVAKHLQNAYAKLGVANRVAALDAYRRATSRPAIAP